MVYLAQAILCNIQDILDNPLSDISSSATLIQLKQLTLQANTLILSQLVHDLPTFTQINHSSLCDDPLTSEMPEDAMTTKLVS